MHTAGRTAESETNSPNRQPSDFIRFLPKAELHLHLEGSVEPATLLELQRRHGISATSAEIDHIYQYQDFTGFLLAFKKVTELLQSPEDYELITYRLMERLRSENVFHAEVYVSVGVCHWQGKDFEIIFEALERGREGRNSSAKSSLTLATRACVSLPMPVRPPDRNPFGER